MTNWSVLTSRAWLLLCIARDPGVRLRDIAVGPGSTERCAYGIVTDLTAAGYVAKQKDGRRNRYQIQAPDLTTFLHAAQKFRENLRLEWRDGPGRGALTELVGSFAPANCAAREHVLRQLPGS